MQNFDDGLHHRHITELVDALGRLTSIEKQKRLFPAGHVTQATLQRYADEQWAIVTLMYAHIQAHEGRPRVPG